MYHDGSLIEVPQRKILVKNNDLRKIRRQKEYRSAAIYGEHAGEANFLDNIIA